MTEGGQKLGDAVKGVFNTVHGAGEVIRGTFNDGVDQIGEGIASDGKSTKPDAERKQDLGLSGHAPDDHSATISDGQQQVRSGLDAIGGHAHEAKGAQ